MSEKMESTKMESVLEALMTVRCGAADSEMQLHTQIAQALLRSGIHAEHEARLGSGARIDFLAWGIGIEVKKSRPDRAGLLRQLERYAAFESIEGLIVVAPRGVKLPAAIGGKRVRMLALERLWGIGLP